MPSTGLACQYRSSSLPDEGLYSTAHALCSRGVRRRGFPLTRKKLVDFADLGRGKAPKDVSQIALRIQSSSPSTDQQRGAGQSADCGDGAASDFKPFTLSRVDQRIIVWLTFVA